jgi:hypothetical protein
MGAPAGQELQAGSYINAVSWTSLPSSRPRFSLWGDGRACGASDAQFTILELARGTPVLVSTGAMVPPVVRLHVQFTQHCADTPAAGLTGELWFIASQ